MESLQQVLGRLEGRPYPAYRDLRGRGYDVGPYAVCFEHVQGDPFASPSRLRVDVPASLPALPPGKGECEGPAGRGRTSFSERLYASYEAAAGEPGVARAVCAAALNRLRSLRIR